MINELLLVLLVALTLATGVMWIDQRFGWWRHPVLCFAGGTIAAGLASMVAPLPDSLRAALLALVSILLFWLGRQSLRLAPSHTFVSAQPSIDDAPSIDGAIDFEDLEPTHA